MARIRWLKATLVQLGLLLCHCPATAEENAATHYLLAIAELTWPLPDYIAWATTDDPDFGFYKRVSERQSSYLQESSAMSALARFDQAASMERCEWGRYSGASWSDAGINDRLHSLARVVLLRARVHYDCGDYIQGNEDVNRVRILARHMALQARPFERQCFMVENMATATAAAYLLDLPADGLDDLYQRDLGMGPYSPMEQMLASEAERIRSLADDFESGFIAMEQVVRCMRPYLDEPNLITISSFSRRELSGNLRGLACYLDALSGLMDRSLSEAEQQGARLHKEYSRDNVLLGSEPDARDYRENAQGVCRSLMVTAVVGRLRRGCKDFSNIDDPYGSSAFEVRATDDGFTLLSELKNPVRIYQHIGLGRTGRGIDKN